MKGPYKALIEATAGVLLLWGPEAVPVVRKLQVDARVTVPETEAERRYLQDLEALYTTFLEVVCP